MTSCSIRSAAITAQPTPVSVNGVTIPRDAIAREVQQHSAHSPVAAWKEAARALAVRELLLQEAKRLGLTPEPETDDAGRRETEDEALIRALIEHEVKTPQPDIATCYRYYEQNRKRFRSGELYEAAHILIAADARDAEAYEVARDKAEIVLALVEREPARFAEFAKTYSDCPSAAQGGNLGQISQGAATPEFEAALQLLTPGTIGREIIATRYGFHIVRLDRKIESQEFPFELMAERIAAYLADSVKRRATAQFIARLAARASITGIELAGAEEHRVN